MDYKKNVLTHEMYYKLRKSVEQIELPKLKVESSITNSLYTVTVFDGECAIGMGRVIGDEIYYIIVDVVVDPGYQRKGIGSNIIKMLIDYIDKETPIGSRSSIQLISEKGKENFYE